MTVYVTDSRIVAACDEALHDVLVVDVSIE